MLLLLIWLQISRQYQQLEQVIEVARHGVRNPFLCPDFLPMPDNENFKCDMELNDVGIRQQFVLGKYIRMKYFGKD